MKEYLNLKEIWPLQQDQDMIPVNKYKIIHLIKFSNRLT